MQKKKKITKKQIETLCKFFENNVGEQTKTYIPFEGISLTVKFSRVFYPQSATIDINDYSLDSKFDKKFSKINHFYDSFANIIVDNFDIWEFILGEEHNKLLSKWEKLTGSFPYDFRKNLGIVGDSAPSFDELWKLAEKSNNNKIDTTPFEVKLSNDYNAIVTHGSDTIEVGCQIIPISNIRKLLEKIDECNSQSNK